MEEMSRQLAARIDAREQKRHRTWIKLASLVAIVAFMLALSLLAPSIVAPRLRFEAVDGPKLTTSIIFLSFPRLDTDRVGFGGWWRWVEELERWRTIQSTRAATRFPTPTNAPSSSPAHATPMAASTTSTSIAAPWSTCTGWPSSCSYVRVSICLFVPRERDPPRRHHQDDWLISSSRSSTSITRCRSRSSIRSLSCSLD